MSAERRSDAEAASPGGVVQEPFREGALVVVWLQNPREQFWGVLCSLSAAGVCLQGISLASFDDYVRQLRLGEALTPLTVFLPLHRVERIEADRRAGGIPSLGERFESGTGKSLRWLQSTEETL